MLKNIPLLFIAVVSMVLMHHTAVAQTFPDDGLKSQELFRYLFGEVNLDVDLRGQFSKGPDSTRKKLWLFHDEKIAIIGIYAGDFLRPRIDQTGYLFRAPDEVRIVSAKFKADDPGKVVMVLSNREVIVIDITYDDSAHKYLFKTSSRTPNISLPFPTKIIGDALYILAGAKVYVSRDTGKTWAIDSVGVGHTSVSDISVDTNYYAWIATYDGVFYQHPDSNVWRRASLLPGNFQTTYSIFVDRRNRVFVTKPGLVFVSTDGGSNWVDISDGISGNVTKYCDDVFGNIYATTLGASYRLKNLTPPWEVISDSISALTYLPQTTNQINSLSGDSILVASTKFGALQSTDQGTTWERVHDSFQHPAHIFYSGVIHDNSYFYITTNLGLFRAALNDSAWEKIFPKHGYLSAVNAIAIDSAGNLYGNFPFKTGPFSSQFVIVKSTDHGDTWSADTAGLGALGVLIGTQAFDFFVDRQGTLYLGGDGKLFSKKPGQEWKMDTTGTGIASGEYFADVSLNNKKGMVYVCRRVGTFPASAFALYRRAVGDSVWQAVNVSTPAATEGRMISDVEGNIVVRTLSAPYKIWRFDGSTWSEIPLPAGLTNPFALRIAVDRSGVLWGAFSGVGGNKGIHFTTDNGSTWKYVGLENVGIKQLTTVGDTAYAVTFIDGVHAFTTSSQPTSIGTGKPHVASAYELYQNYPNPFNPSTTISFKIQASGFISLKVYDLLGRETAVLLNEERKAGTHSVRFDGSRLSSGVYIYSLRAWNFSESKKLLLMK